MVRARNLKQFRFWHFLAVPVGRECVRVQYNIPRPEVVARPGEDDPNSPCARPPRCNAAFIHGDRTPGETWAATNGDGDGANSSADYVRRRSTPMITSIRRGRHVLGVITTVDLTAKTTPAHGLASCSPGARQ
jgi:hypothetical protein